MVACAFRRRSLEADDLGIWLTPQAKSRIEPASIEGYMTMGDAIRKKLNSIREPKPTRRGCGQNLGLNTKAQTLSVFNRTHST